MALAETLLSNRSIEARIEKIELSIPILQEHVEKFGEEIEPEAYEFIIDIIEFLKRELEIRKDFPLIYF